MSHRVSLESAYVLHTRPYRDTSLLVELFTRNYGRITAVSRGARGPKSKIKGYLQPFYPLLATWSGKSELVSLNTVEPCGAPFLFVGKTLVSAIYVNELTMRLLHRHEEHPELFMEYQQVLLGLQNDNKLISSLRRFEKKLISSLGYGFDWHITADTFEVIEPGKYYALDPSRGILMASHDPHALMILGDHLLAIQADDYSDTAVLNSAKRVLRSVLNYLLGGREINSRELL